MPYSANAEEALLGAMLIDDSAVSKALELLSRPDQFYVEANAMIFEAIIRLYEKRHPIDITTVSEELAGAGKLEAIGGRNYIVELASNVATGANADYYARIVLEKSTLRDLIRASTDIISQCYAQAGEVDELLDAAESNIFSISEYRIRSGFTSISDLLPGTFEAIEDYKEQKGGLAGYPTGFYDLDDITAGLHLGDLVIIAGRPSMGKSALAMNVVENFCTQTEKAAAVFSLEMSKEQLAMRMLCGRARISSHKLRTNRLPENDWPKLATAAQPLSNAKIYIDDTPGITILEMRAKARRLASQVDLGLVVVDYLQMMSGPARAENRQQEISQISRGIKGLAKELQVPVIAVSQLSRMVETRGGDRRPQLSDLRESGAIEQDADVVMFVYREEYYLQTLPPDDPKLLEARGKAEIIVAKQRNGPTGVVRLSFLKDYAQFENLAGGHRTGSIPPPESGPPIDF